jgi:hypothetical protein
MTKETTKRDEDIEPEAIARWNNDGGAPGPLKRGTSRLRFHDRQPGTHHLVKTPDLQGIQTPGPTGPV